MIYPLIEVKCTRISSNRVGHLILEIDWFLSSIKPAGRRVTLFFFSTPTPVNYTIAEIAKNEMNFIPRFFGFGVYFWIRLFNLRKLQEDIPRESEDFLIFDRSTNGFNADQEFQTQGELLLKSLGIPRNAPIVCIYVRDGAYGRKLFGEIDQTFADYRDSHIENYLPAMEFLANQGYFVIRMGRVTNSKLQTQNRNIFDYSNCDSQSDLADVYLSYKCAFAISTDTGMTHFPLFFRKPIGLANVAGFHGLLHTKLVKYVIPKTYKDLKSGKELSLSKIFMKNLDRFKASEEFHKEAVELIECSAEEILGLAMDMSDWYEKSQLPNQESKHEEDFFSSSISKRRSKPYYSKLSGVWLSNHPLYLDK